MSINKCHAEHFYTFSLKLANNYQILKYQMSLSTLKNCTCVKLCIKKLGNLSGVVSILEHTAVISAGAENTAYKEYLLKTDIIITCKPSLVFWRAEIITDCSGFCITQF